MPKLSILMPFRDSELFLNEALDSLFAQSFEAWELIAVDDGSRDLSRSILEAARRREPRLRLFETEPGRRGMVAALNLGLGHARAPLLARMDSDDRSLPRRFELQRRALEVEPSLFAVSCRVRGFPDDLMGEGMGRYLDWQNSLLEPEELMRDRFVESPLVHSSVMMRTVVLKRRLQGWRECGWAEDWDLWLRAMEEGLRMRRLPETLLEWRLHAGQATRLDPRYSEDNFLRARAHFLARFLRLKTSCCREEVNGRRLWILGAGPVGKRLAKALADEGVELAGFVDIDPKKIGGHAGPRRWPVASMEELQAASPGPFAVSAVGQKGGRERVRARLLDDGWVEGRDFVVAA